MRVCSYLYYYPTLTRNDYADYMYASIFAVPFLCACASRGAHASPFRATRDDHAHKTNSVYALPIEAATREKCDYSKLYYIIRSATTNMIAISIATAMEQLE